LRSILGISVFLLALYLFRWRRMLQRTPIRIAFGACLLAAACVGCGESGDASVPAGSYTFRITAQSGTLTHTAHIQVTVK
jgi:O-antigen ligase